MTDISSYNHLEILMRDFYSRLLADERISYFFTQVAGIDLEKHIPRIASFWAQNLLGEGSYSANVMKIHLDINSKSKISKEHFDIWLGHLHSAADSRHAGPVTENLKTRALSIATAMQLKIKT